jgi:ParB/RepB/Spo0J family partition protein
MDELIESIKEVGLITPIAVCATEKEYHDKGVKEAWRLLAGERRLRACKELGHTEIGVRIFTGDVSRLSAKTIEGAENLCREDLTAEEHVMLVKEIHEEQTRIHGEHLHGSHSDSGWSQKDTANLLGLHESTVSLELKAAELISQHPELGKLEGLKKSDLINAIKTMQQQDAAQKLNVELEERARVTTSEVTKNLANTLIVDTESQFLLLENEYDLIFADFRLGLFSFERLETFFLSLKVNSWLITIGAPTMSLAIHKPFYVRLCYDVKPSTTNVHELVNEVFHGYYYAKGNPQLYKPGSSNLFAIYKRNEIVGDDHLYKSILSTFTFPGCKVLFPFINDGTELIEASKLGLIPTGYTDRLETKNLFLRKLTELEVTDGSVEKADGKN